MHNVDLDDYLGLYRLEETALTGVQKHALEKIQRGLYMYAAAAVILSEERHRRCGLDL